MCQTSIDAAGIDATVAFEVRNGTDFSCDGRELDEKELVCESLETRTAVTFAGSNSEFNNCSEFEARGAGV